MSQQRLQMIKRCTRAALNMRKQIVDMTYCCKASGAHIGGALSMVELMAVLYLEILRYDREDLQSSRRDRFILSKGHGAMCLYAAMNQAGLLTDEELHTFKKNGSFFGGHPSRNQDKMIEFSSGSLGQGLSLGVGVCLALKRLQNHMPRTYVLLGDGECNEGSVWEAAMSAGHYHLDNLIAIIDRNRLQYDGETKEVMDMEKMEEAWSGFGWDTIVIDGHSIEAIYDTLTKTHDRPFVILADTVKGKGISFMEQSALWHNNRLSEEQYQKALGELEKQDAYI